MADLHALRRYIRRREQDRDPRSRRIAEMSARDLDDLLRAVTKNHPIYTDLPLSVWSIVARAGLIAVAEATVWPWWEGELRLGVRRIARHAFERAMSRDVGKLLNQGRLQAFYRYQNDENQLKLASVLLGQWIFRECFGQDPKNSDESIYMCFDVGNAIGQIGSGIGAEIVEPGRMERLDREYKAQLEADDALERAVRAVREAEAAGRLGVDSRSDAELKESIRKMWDRDRRNK